MTFLHKLAKRLAQLKGAFLTSMIVGTIATSACQNAPMMGPSAASPTGTSTTPSGPGRWPNELPGLTVLSDVGFAAPIPVGQGMDMGNGWNINNTQGLATSVTDPTAPIGPYVMKMAYPNGFVGGSGPANAYFYFNSRQEFYVGFWWKANSSWQGHLTSVNKLCFIWASSGTPIIPEMYGPPGGPYRLRTAIWESGVPEPRDWAEANVGNGTLVPGTWYRIEIYAKYGTSSNSFNGILNQWINGVLVTSYSDINYNAAGFDSFQISPTWGGQGDVKTQDDFFAFDDVHISGR
jgi:hypothetical protein